VTTIDELRAGIDDVDARIVALVLERRELSRGIQVLRRGSGGGAVSPERERVILDRYREGLGDAGAVVAEAVLLVCRGRV
jgi:chorismate mutase